MEAKLTLKSLKLQNYATFENQTINFHPLFNSIVGETGSGKSLVLDALHMSFGGRASKDAIRKNSTFATIETIFSPSSDNIFDYFDSIGHPIEEEIIIKRIIYTSGKSKNFLNYQSCSLNLLSQVSRVFIDIIGQFENQKLLSEEYQIKLLDDYSNISKKVLDYKQKYFTYKNLKKELEVLYEEKSNSVQKKEYLKFQISKLEDLDLSIDNEENLKKKKNAHINHEKKAKAILNIEETLNQSDHSILNQFQSIKKEIDNISIDQILYNKMLSIISEIEDFSFEVSKYNIDHNAIDYNIEDIMEELDAYQQLKRKFNTDTTGLYELLAHFKKDLYLLENIDLKIEVLENKINELEISLYLSSNEIHQKREKASKVLSTKITSLINKLNMEGASVKIEILKLQSLRESGISKLNFLVETNPGEGPYLLKKIASGGELSRIFLSLRQILGERSSISVFLFDEIDAGVGGDTAIKIGKALKDVSLNGQVIAITHLPQIANFSNQLIAVDKKSVSNKDEWKTHSNITLYNNKSKKDYITQMQIL